MLPYFIRSLEEQRFPHEYWELIVVDGGSVDHSLELIHNGKYRCHSIVDLTRNMGYVRNEGAHAANGEILFFTNSDAMFPADFIKQIYLKFDLDPELQALSGATVPYEGGALAFAGYFCFDKIRSFMANYLGKFSPSGNFLAIRKEAFWKVGAFPYASVNEDGILGQQISRMRLKARFDLDLKTGHFAKRFAKRGPLKTLLFYSYVFGNFSPTLSRILAPIERNSGEAFKKK